MSQSHQQEPKPTILVSQSVEVNQPGQMEGLNSFQEGLLVDYSKNFQLEMNFVEEEEMNFDAQNKNEEASGEAPSQEMGQMSKGFTQEIVQQQKLYTQQKGSLIGKENFTSQGQTSDVQNCNQVGNQVGNDFKQGKTVSEVLQESINSEKKLNQNKEQENIIEEEKMVEENLLHEHPSRAVQHEQPQTKEKNSKLPEYLLSIQSQHVETIESNMDIQPIQQDSQFPNIETDPNPLDQSLILLQPQSIKNPEEKFQIKLVGDYYNDKLQGDFRIKEENNSNSRLLHLNLEKIEHPLLQSVEGDLNLGKQERNQSKRPQHLSGINPFSQKKQSFQYFKESDQSVTNCQFIKENCSDYPKNLLKEFKNEHYQVRDRYFEEESRIYKKYILNMQRTLRKQYEKCRLRGDYLSISFDQDISNTKEEMERKIIHLDESRIKEQFESRKYHNKDDSEILSGGNQKNQYKQNNEYRQGVEMKLSSKIKQSYETMKLYQGQGNDRIMNQLLVEFEHLKNEHIESNSAKFRNYLRHVMIHMSKFQDLSDRVQEMLKMSYKDLMEFYSNVVGTRNVINYHNFTQKESHNDSDSNQFNDYLDDEDIGLAVQAIEQNEKNVVPSQRKILEHQQKRTQLVADILQANPEHLPVTSNNFTLECTKLSTPQNSINLQQLANTQRNSHFCQLPKQLTILQTQLQMAPGIISTLQQLSNYRTQSQSDPMNQLLKPKPEESSQDYQIIEEIDEQEGTPVFGAGLLGLGEHNVLQVSQDKKTHPTIEPNALKPSSQPLLSFSINNTFTPSFTHPLSSSTNPSAIVPLPNATPTPPTQSEQRIFSQQKIQFGSSLVMQKSIEKMSAQQLREFIKNSFAKKSEVESSNGNIVTQPVEIAVSLTVSEQIELENQTVVLQPIPQQQVSSNIVPLQSNIAFNPKENLALQESSQLQKPNINDPQRQQQVIDILSEDSEQSLKIPFLQPLQENTQTNNTNPNTNITASNQQQSPQRNQQTLSSPANITPQTNQSQPFQYSTQHYQQPTQNFISQHFTSSSSPSKHKQPSTGISAHDIRAVLLETYPNLEAIIFAASDEEILALYFQLTGKQDAIALENHHEHKKIEQGHFENNMRIDTIQQTQIDNNINQNNHISQSLSINPFQSLPSNIEHPSSLTNHPQTTQPTLLPSSQVSEQLPPSYQQELTYEQLDIVIKNLIEANESNPELKEQISQLSREELLVMYREGMRQSRKEQKVKRKTKGPAQVIDLDEQPNTIPTSTNNNGSIPLQLQSNSQSFSYLQIFNQMQQHKKSINSTNFINSINPKKILVNKNYLYSYIEAHDWDSRSLLHSILKPKKESLRYQQQTKKEVATIYLKTTQQNGPLHKIMNDVQRHEGKENSFILLGQKQKPTEIRNQSIKKDINEENHIFIEKPTITEERKNRILELRNKRLLNNQSTNQQQPQPQSPITKSRKATHQFSTQSLISIPGVSTPFLSTILSPQVKTCRRYWLMVEEQDMDPRQGQRLQEEIGLQYTKKRVKRTFMEKDDKKVLKLIKQLAQHLGNEIQLE